MQIWEETDEYRFVQHAISILGVENARPDLEPGGLWISGKLSLSWGMRTATEPPTLVFDRQPPVLNGRAAFLPYNLEGRLIIWRAAFANRESSPYPNFAKLDFRDVCKIAAILGWNWNDHDP